jgi:hypothetical protein
MSCMAALEGCEFYSVNTVMLLIECVTLLHRHCSKYKNRGITRFAESWESAS